MFDEISETDATSINLDSTAVCRTPAATVSNSAPTAVKLVAACATAATAGAGAGAAAGGGRQSRVEARMMTPEPPLPTMGSLRERFAT